MSQVLFDVSWIVAVIIENINMSTSVSSESVVEGRGIFGKMDWPILAILDIMAAFPLVELLGAGGFSFCTRISVISIISTTSLSLGNPGPKLICVKLFNADNIVTYGIL